MRQDYTRREMIKHVAGLGLGAGAAAAWPGLWTRRAAAASNGRQPNIVFVLVDDQPHDALGFMQRYPFLDTPNMDRLAREGAHVQNAFVTTSLCSPSRATFLSGEYAHRHDVRYNDGTDLPTDAPNFCEVLRHHGYETAFVGKWHQGPSDEPRRGFDHWVSFSGQGNYFDQRMNVNGKHVQTTGYNADVLTDYAADYLRQPREKPFCMCLWHKSVHAPFKPAPRHEDAFADASMDEPASFDDTFADKPRWLRRGYAHGGWQKEAWQQSADREVPERIAPEAWDTPDARMRQLRALLAVDESLGRVMDTLEATGQLDDTIIVFSSDNGYFFGEHRRHDKRLAYEQSIRIPMLVRYPRAIEAGTEISEMVLNNDLAPTLLEMAGAPTPDSMQGTSFAPLLRGKDVAWRDAWLYEYFAEPWWLPGVPTMLAVRTDRWKYITYPEDDYIDELYDLKRDPHELNNLADDPAHSGRLKQMRAELERLKRETDYQPKPEHEQPIDVEPTTALHYDFEKLQGKTLKDASGHGHDGWMSKGELVNGRDGAALATMAGGLVRLDDTPETLSPKRKPLALSVWAKAEAPEGVLACFGGKAFGFSLYVRDGKPEFAVRNRRRLLRATAGQRVPKNQWFHLTGVIDREQNLLIYLDGERVAKAKGSLVLAHPRNGFAVGTDTGSPVGRYGKQRQWQGYIDDVRLFWGVPDPQAIEAWAS